MKECLLISEPPLQVLPSLAKAIGLNEAIVLQQLYWLLKDERNGTVRDGRRWIYNTISQWQQNFFPFWSEDTVMRTFQNLEAMLLIDTCQPEGRQSRQKYYRLNEGGITKLTTENFPNSSDNRKLSVSNSSDNRKLSVSITANCQLPYTNKEHITKNTVSPPLTPPPSESESSKPPYPPQAGGSDSATKINGSVAPTTPEAKRITALYKRRETTAWSQKEIRAFRNLGKIDPDDLDAVEKYYLSESRKKENYCRRDLLTLLNNFPGEVDRARGWQEKKQRREQREKLLYGDDQ